MISSYFPEGPRCLSLVPIRLSAFFAFSILLSFPITVTPSPPPHLRLWSCSRFSEYLQSLQHRQTVSPANILNSESENRIDNAFYYLIYSLSLEPQFLSWKRERLQRNSINPRHSNSSKFGNQSNLKGTSSFY